MEALELPVLIVCGDEDEPCIQPSLWLKKVLPNAGLTFFAKTGHTVNIEEPDAFNRELWNFLALAEAGRSAPADSWGTTHTDAVSYLAAHLLATRSMQIGQQVGSPAGNPMGVQLESTLYGQEYRRLLAQLPISGFAF